MPRTIKTKRRHDVCEAQNWRCCFCGVRMIAKGLEDARDHALQNGLKFHQFYEQNTAVRYRVANVFRVEGGRGVKVDLAAACTYCVSARGSLPVLAWAKLVEMMVLAGEHPCHKSPDAKNSITYRPKALKDWGRIRERRPRYAHSELM